MLDSYFVRLCVWDRNYKRRLPPTADVESEVRSSETPVNWVREMLGFRPDALQARVLSTSSRRGILNCTRQWGKSTVTAAKAVHQAWCEARSLTIVVNPTARQSGEFVRKAAEFARRLDVKPKGD